jgi:hypothetical protein
MNQNQARVDLEKAWLCFTGVCGLLVSTALLALAKANEIAFQKDVQLFMYLIRRRNAPLDATVEDTHRAL